MVLYHVCFYRKSINMNRTPTCKTSKNNEYLNKIMCINLFLCVDVAKTLKSTYSLLIFIHKFKNNYVLLNFFFHFLSFPLRVCTMFTSLKHF